MRVTISVDENLLEKIDAYAAANYNTRSGIISLACSQHIQQAEVFALVKDMSLAMQKIAASGEISPEEYKTLKQFEVFANMISK